MKRIIHCEKELLHWQRCFVVFWDTENLLGIKRKHITSIRKCNDILSSAINFECDTIGSYYSKYHNISNGKKPL